MPIRHVSRDPVLTTVIRDGDKSLGDKPDVLQGRFAKFALREDEFPDARQPRRGIEELKLRLQQRIQEDAFARGKGSSNLAMRLCLQTGAQQAGRCLETAVIEILAQIPEILSGILSSVQPVEGASSITSDENLGVNCT